MRLCAARKETILGKLKRKLSVQKEEVRNRLIRRRRTQLLTG